LSSLIPVRSRLGLLTKRLFSLFVLVVSCPPFPPPFFFFASNMPASSTSTPAPAENKQPNNNTDGSETVTKTEIVKIDTDPRTTDSNLRYIAYIARLKRVLLIGTRYLAFTSDVGEAFRPVAHPRLVTAAYAISWGYVVADVSYEGYKEKKRGGDTMDITNVVAKRAVFQSLASMGLPALAIHTQVRVFASVCKSIGRFQKWGPTVAGLALLPFLPFMFDYPVEHLVDKYWPWPEKHKPAKEVIVAEVVTEVKKEKQH
jgi:fission process protein 1